MMVSRTFLSNLTFILLLALLDACKSETFELESSSQLTAFTYLFARTDPKSVRSYIDFQVICPEPDTAFSWAVIAGYNTSVVSMSSSECSTVHATCQPGGGRPAKSFCDSASLLALDDEIALDFKLAASGMVKSCYHEAGDETPMKRVNNLTFDGPYTLYIEAYSNMGSDEENRSLPSCHPRKVSATAVFMNVNGELGADDYPLLAFYGITGIVYLVLGIVWVILMLCNYADLLRVQFQIGGVVFLAMFEMAVTYAKFDYFNDHGFNSSGLLFFSAILYAAKGTVSRLLVLVVSMGYGVVKPRLGNTYKQVAAIGVAYFFFAATDRLETNYGVEDVEDPSAQYILRIPLAIIDSALIWWIFLSLHHTMKILLLRQNAVKLSLYQKFRFHLFICVMIAVGNVVWTAINFDAPTGIERYETWRIFWWNEASWQLVFLVVLVGIMILWRPTLNNSRYAYAVLETDLDDDDDYQVTPHFGASTLKSRLSRGHSVQNAALDENTEDDLQWVEDNIPVSGIGTDANFPNFPMDSDEEIMNTRYELSKMN